MLVNNCKYVFLVVIISTITISTMTTAGTFPQTAICKNKHFTNYLHAACSCEMVTKLKSPVHIIQLND